MLECSLDDEFVNEFRGATLSIEHKPNENYDNNDKENYTEIDNNDKINSNINNNQWKINNIVSPLTTLSYKFMGSWWKDGNGQTNKEHDKNLTIQQTHNVVEEDPRNYFTFREEVIARALLECKEQFLDDDCDGVLKAAFLLTQISSWNSDKERLILLTTKVLVIVKYDFIALKRLAYNKLPLENIEKIIIGDLVYPHASLIPNRNRKGIRLVWKESKQGFTSHWNPFKENSPYCTFTYHPLYFNNGCENEDLKNLYNLELFIDKLSNIIINLNLNNNDIIKKENIILENYIGIGSVIHNRNSLGFFKVRGKFSF